MKDDNLYRSYIVKTIYGERSDLMKTILILLAVVLFFTTPGFSYHIEVLQVSNIAAYDQTYKGFLDELAQNGIVQDKNLTINKHIIEADPSAGLWKKVFILMKIKKTASEIVSSKPDLVLTVSTPGTKYSMEKFISAGIPVVFACVANPFLIGCQSVEKPLPGITGATLYIDPFSLLTVVQMAIPGIKKLGIVHSDDDNAIAFAQESSKKAKQLGITIVAKQVEKSDPIIPAAQELIKQGVDAFAIPLDQYYGLRNLGPAKDLMTIAAENKKPIFSFANFDFGGALLYVGPEFGYNGVLAGKQAVAILKYRMKPQDLPILRQQDIKIIVDKGIARQLGIVLPAKLLKIAKER